MSRWVLPGVTQDFGELQRRDLVWIAQVHQQPAIRPQESHQPLDEIIDVAKAAASADPSPQTAIGSRMPA